MWEIDYFVFNLRIMYAKNSLCGEIFPGNNIS